MFRTTFIGMMLGCTFWGMLTDVYGRLVTFFIPLLIAGILMICISMARSFLQLCFLYGLIGFMISSSLTNDGTLFVELVPKSHEYLIMVLSTFWGVGTCFAAVLGFVLLQNDCLPQDKCHTDQWRSMVAVLGVVTLVLGGIRWLVRHRVHQSVQFLASKHDWRNVHKILSRIAEHNQYSDEEFESMMSHIDEASIESQEKQNFCQRMRPLFSRRRYRYSFDGSLDSITLSIWCIWGLLSLAYTIFNGYIFKLLESVQTEQRINPYSVYLVFSVGNIPGTFVAAWIAKHVSYRRIFIGSTFTVSMGIFCFYLWMKVHYETVLLVTMMSFYG
jgi:MFS family permease